MQNGQVVGQERYCVAQGLDGFGPEPGNLVYAAQGMMSSRMVGLKRARASGNRWRLGSGDPPPTCGRARPRHRLSMSPSFAPVKAPLRAGSGGSRQSMESQFGGARQIPEIVIPPSSKTGTVASHRSPNLTILLLQASYASGTIVPNMQTGSRAAKPGSREWQGA